MLQESISICFYKEKYQSSLVNLIHKTIQKSYPHCYSKEVIDFFLKYHSEKALKQKAAESVLLLAKINSEVVGCVYLFKDEIGGLYVDPDYQRYGIGSLLLGHILDIAGKSQLKKVWLDATPVSKDLYMEKGFKLIEKKVMYVKNNAPLEYYYMTKDL